MIRAVLFDLDETLTDRPSSIIRYARRLQADFATELLDSPPEVIARIVAHADQRGYAPRETVFRALQSGLGWRRKVEVGELSAHWDRWFPLETACRTDVVSTLQALQNRGFRLGIVTNGVSRRQEPKIDAMGIRGMLAAVVVSERVGFRKPDPEIFVLAAEAIGCEPPHVWFVGDHPENDVAGAERAGMRGVWLRGVHAWPQALPPPVYQIDDLAEILTIVNG